MNEDNDLKKKLEFDSHGELIKSDKNFRTLLYHYLNPRVGSLKVKLSKVSTETLFKAFSKLTKSGNLNQKELENLLIRKQSSYIGIKTPRKKRKVKKYVVNDLYTTYKWRVLKDEVLRERGIICERCKATESDVGTDGNPLDFYVDHNHTIEELRNLNVNKDNVKIFCHECSTDRKFNNLRGF